MSTVTETFGVLPADGSIDPNDISNGFYPHLRKVSPANPEFLDVIAWLQSKGAPRKTRLVARSSQTPDGPGRWMPAAVVFEGDNDRVLDLDAAMVFNFPHVALVDLKNYFGFGNPSQVEFYPGLRQTVGYVQISPIGAAWPEQGENCYRPADSDHLEYGAVYIDQTGHYRKDRHSWAFISYGVWVKLPS